MRVLAELTLPLRGSAHNPARPDVAPPSVAYGHHFIEVRLRCRNRAKRSNPASTLYYRNLHSAKILRIPEIRGASMQNDLAKSDSVGIPSRQRDDEYARDLRRVCRLRMVRQCVITVHIAA